MIFGVLALLPLTLAVGAGTEMPAFTREGWIALAFLGTIAGAIQFSLFTWALRWLAPSRVVIYLTLNPITAMLLAVLMLGEPLSSGVVVGLLFVLAGILVANLARPARTAAIVGRS